MVKTEPVDDILVPHSQARTMVILRCSYWVWIRRSTRFRGKTTMRLHTSAAASGSLSLDPWEECCKRSVSFGSTHSVEGESNDNYFPILQPVTLAFVYDPENGGGAHALSSIANPVSTSSIVPFASSSNPSTSVSSTMSSTTISSSAATFNRSLFNNGNIPIHKGLNIAQLMSNIWGKFQ
ncbi:hypothetical protein DFH08DRAFT_822344 [Mycena albidolilacea]|uniref:Uncharacterized protein n=1 Tax=Mycena albidolilacea TaxID=1033008 RepID=A0AAD7EDC9_9AGAR|nr:hypothetical protein DFH08DRAFT_822344 [Mycena albidolilacea]